MVTSRQSDNHHHRGNMKKVRHITVLVLLPMIALQARAGEKEINPWTDCGIGALVFSGIDGKTGKILAAVSNLTWDLGTTAVSSATSSPGTCNGVETTSAIFIQQNIRVVEEQIATGEGEHLNALLDIYGCSSDVKPAILKSLRTEAHQLFAEPSYHEADRAKQAEALWSDLNTVIEVSYRESCSA